jgi:hypothetical protein
VWREEQRKCIKSLENELVTSCKNNIGLSHDAASVVTGFFCPSIFIGVFRFKSLVCSFFPHHKCRVFFVFMKINMSPYLIYLDQAKRTFHLRFQSITYGIAYLYGLQRVLALKVLVGSMTSGHCGGTSVKTGCRKSLLGHPSLWWSSSQGSENPLLCCKQHLATRNICIDARAFVHPWQFFMLLYLWGSPAD